MSDHISNDFNDARTHLGKRVALPQVLSSRGQKGKLPPPTAPRASIDKLRLNGRPRRDFIDWLGSQSDVTNLSNKKSTGTKIHLWKLRSGVRVNRYDHASKTEPTFQVEFNPNVSDRELVEEIFHDYFQPLGWRRLDVALDYPVDIDSLQVDAKKFTRTEYETTPRARARSIKFGKGGDRMYRVYDKALESGLTGVAWTRAEAQYNIKSGMETDIPEGMFDPLMVWMYPPIGTFDLPTTAKIEFARAKPGAYRRFKNSSKTVEKVLNEHLPPLDPSPQDLFAENRSALQSRLNSFLGVND